MSKKGKLIVIDGTDGSGKATQVKKLKERLKQENYKVESLDFPRYYDNFFGKFIGEALRGEYGDWKNTHPKIASIVYAADRQESASTIKQWLDEGNIVILDRYVSSNQIHQGGKIHNQEERKEFMNWLDTMEHEIMGIPRPDLILYLNVPISVTQKLLIQKGNKESKEYLGGKGDQHEDDPQHLEDAKQSGLKMIAENNHWIQIDCAPNETMRSIEDIHEDIYAQLQDLL
ncbi:MAG: deoxynucleoside kinase [Candidatus Pacebacteria bacterium]|nr:deoxynucleoside kinase [Candidatus Paceibacterota bacterium]